jgi:hypothetical protein
MQRSSLESVQIASPEWRWVVLVAALLLLVAFTPFLWLALSDTGEDQWQFMGILNSNYRDGATYISKMQQGYEGGWLVYFRHSPDIHSPVFIQVLYPLLGHIARILGIPIIALFHVARVIAALIMYMALYQFAAVIWPRRRSRRIFFLLVTLGSGLGWLAMLFSGTPSTSDFVIPEMFPFYSTLVNVHFPLTIAFLALLASILIVMFRPGCVDLPTVANGGLVLALLSLGLSLLYPQALVPIGIAVSLYVFLHGVRLRRIPDRELRWWLVLIAPALPMAGYYVAIVNYNPAVAEWNRQNVTASPDPFTFLIGLGVPLLIALPGIIRAIRHFEQDGDQMMLIWLLSILVVMYLPTNIQRRFTVGILIVIAYFATRALESFWFNFINRRWRYRLLMAVVPMMTMTTVFILLSNMTIVVGPFLPRDYANAISWLRTNADTSEVVVASSEVSIWLPGLAGTRVVYGHPFETLEAAQREQQIVSWYSGAYSDCRQLLTEYDVRYVIFGPLEQDLGTPTCLSALREVSRFGSVALYAP